MEGNTDQDVSLDDLKLDLEDLSKFNTTLFNILNASDFYTSENGVQYPTDHNYSSLQQTNPPVLSQLPPPGLVETEVRHHENQFPLLPPPEYMDSVHLKTESLALQAPGTSFYDPSGNMTPTVNNEASNVGDQVIQMQFSLNDIKEENSIELPVQSFYPGPGGYNPPGQINNLYPDLPVQAYNNLFANNYPGGIQQLASGSEQLAFNSVPYNQPHSNQENNKQLSSYKMKMSKIRERCEVCGDKSSGRHYDVFACEGCKLFFRRAVTKNRQYPCRKRSHACQVTKDNRKGCKACRLKKCYDVKMNPNSVVISNNNEEGVTGILPNNDLLESAMKGLQ